MTDINDRNISQWIERFLDGETSCGEEQALYDYFRHDNLPPEAEKFRQMFMWYDSLADSGTTKHTETSACETDGENRGGNKAGILRLRPWRWAGIAAMLALILTIGAISIHNQKSIPEAYMAYEGSYIIRNGKKITDLRVVVPEIIRAEKMVNERLQALDSSIDEAENAFDRSVADSYDTSDPEVRKIVDAALSY